MRAKRIAAWSLAPLLLLPAGARCSGQNLAPELTARQAQELVQQALGKEISAAENSGHPMRYLLRKVTPRLTTTKKIVESSDGDVARLVSVNGKALSAAADQREEARLDTLAANPANQDHRKQSEDADTERAMKVLRALPSAFVYRYTGPGTSAAGPVETYAFTPNPGYSPTGMETQILTAMTGEIAIDPFAKRVVKLEGRLQHSVSYAWGILGRLNQGGWIAIEQAPVADSQWRTVRLQLAMTGRILFFTKSYDTLEEESDYRRVPEGLGYREAIGMLKRDP